MDEFYFDVHLPQLSAFGADEIIIHDTGVGFKVFYQRGGIVSCPFFNGSRQKIWKSLAKAYEAAHRVRSDCNPNNQPNAFNLSFPV